MSVLLFRVLASVVCAVLGAVLLFGTARSRRWAAPVKEIPQTKDGETFTAITLELVGAPAWVLISAAVLGAIVFGVGGRVAADRASGPPPHAGAEARSEGATTAALAEAVCGVSRWASAARSPGLLRR